MKKGQKYELKIDRIEDRKIEFATVVFIFLLCAFIGWCFEEVYCYLCFNKWVSRGMMFGPLCSIYGYGAIILYLLFYNVKATKTNIPYIFLTAATVLGAFELVSGLFLKYVLNMEMWNYDGQFLEILNYTTVPILIGWGILGTIYVYLIQPILIKLTSVVPKRFSKHLAIVLLCLYLVDFLLSYLNVNINPEVLYNLVNPV